MSDLSSIFVHSHCVSKTQLLAYIRQKLDKEETHLVESHLNDCQFCNDALDALLEADMVQAEQDISDVKIELTKKLFPPVEMTTATPLSKKNDHNKNNVRDFEISRYNFKRLLAAASVLLIIGLGGYSVFSFIKSNKKELAINEKGKGSSGYDAEYSKADNDDDEIVRLNVEANDTFRKYAEGEAKSSRFPEEVGTTSTFKAPSVNKDEVVAPKAVMEEKPLEKSLDDKAPKVLSKVAPSVAATDNLKMIEPAPGMENYARESKNDRIQSEAVKEVAKKKSPAGMKYDNNANIQQAQQNQLNYSRGNNNDYYQRNNDAKGNIDQTVSQKQENYEEAEKEMSNYEKGMDNFNNKNYKKSISFFEKALKKATGTEREDIIYHLALAYEYTGKNSKANELYATLINSKKYSENAERKLKEVRSEEAIKKK